MKRKNIFLPVAFLVACAAFARESTDETTPTTLDPPVIASPDIGDVVFEPDRPSPPAMKIEKIGEKIVPSDDPKSRAWSTAVGWHPGASAFPDPVTHESQLNLVKFPTW